jgi:hypothetical protein
VAAAGNAWYRRTAPIEGGRWVVSCYQNDDQPDGATIGPHDLPPAPPVGDMLWHAELGSSNRTEIIVTPTGAPGAPAAWFVAIRDRHEDRPRVTLVAFCTEHRPDGTVVTDVGFVAMPIRSESQTGAIRWWADTAVIDEIYVQPDQRRGHLGGKLVYTASGYHQHHGWPGRLRTDGRRTDLGQEFAVGLRHPQRTATWTHRAAPMTPPPRD